MQQYTSNLECTIDLIYFVLTVIYSYIQVWEPASCWRQFTPLQPQVSLKNPFRNKLFYLWMLSFFVKFWNENLLQKKCSRSECRKNLLMFFLFYSVLTFNTKINLVKSLFVSFNQIFEQWQRKKNSQNLSVYYHHIIILLTNIDENLSVPTNFYFLTDGKHSAVNTYL